MKKVLTIALFAAAAFGAEGFKLLNKIKIGGTGGWDYVTLDPVNRRLYVSHGAIVEVVDPDAGKVVGQITELHGVHGIAVAPDLNKGFITNGQSGSVTSTTSIPFFLTVSKAARSTSVAGLSFIQLER